MAGRRMRRVLGVCIAIEDGAFDFERVVVVGVSNEAK